MPSANPVDVPFRCIDKDGIAAQPPQDHPTTGHGALRVAAARAALPVPQEHSDRPQLSVHILSPLARCRTASAPPSVPGQRSRYVPPTQPARPPRSCKSIHESRVYNEYQEDRQFQYRRRAARTAARAASAAREIIGNSRGPCD